MERFEPEEGAAAGVARIIARTMERAERQLREAKNPMTRVHDARKRIKEIRAALRLVRDGLGERFARENEWFRAESRSLTAAREADANVAMLEKLAEDAGSDAERAAVARAKERLAAERARVVAGGLEVQLERLANDLAARPRLAWWEIGDRHFDTIADGLETAARRARRAFRRAKDGGSDVDFHTWRKRAKDLWNQIRFLQPIKGRMKKRAAKLKELSRLLGDHHDLSVLRVAAGDEPVLQAFISRRLAALERRSLALGDDIHAEKPKRLRARAAKKWDAWRADAPRSGVNERSRIETANS